MPSDVIAEVMPAEPAEPRRSEETRHPGWVISPDLRAPEMAVGILIADAIDRPSGPVDAASVEGSFWDKASIGKRTATASAISAGAPWPLTDGFVCCRGDSRRVMSSGTGLPGHPHAAVANSGDRRAIPIATRVPSTSVTGTPASPNSSLNCGPMTLAGSTFRPLPSAQVR